MVHPPMSTAPIIIRVPSEFSGQTRLKEKHFIYTCASMLCMLNKSLINRRNMPAGGHDF